MYSYGTEDMNYPGIRDYQSDTAQNMQRSTLCLKQRASLVGFISSSFNY
jgi:hypothetical protein